MSVNTSVSSSLEQTFKSVSITLWKLFPLRDQGSENFLSFIEFSMG